VLRVALATMIFRQLFEPLSCTYTYLVACADTRMALLIDPVVNSIERDLAALHELGLTLAYTLDTHIHADHITGALHLKQRVNSKIAMPAMDRLPCTDVGIVEGTPFQVGALYIKPLHTPGHTDSHFAYVLDDCVFSGDSLLIDGCGRTDFQNGDAAAMFRSVTQKLFTLPDDHRVYPGHDYQQRRVSSIGQERARNPRLGGQQTLHQFQRIMAELKLPYPKFIDYALPGNQRCGVCPQDLPQQIKAYCERMSESPQT
jgi:sulfur dioxygenase